MKPVKNIFFLGLLFGLFAGCQKDQFKNTSFVTSASKAANVGVMFTITQDNTGSVTIYPSGVGIVSYDILAGDTSKTPVTIPAGASLTHIYPEGVYQVSITGHDLQGGTATTTQTLTVSYVTPQNLAVNLSTAGLTVSVSATAKYATYYKFYFGDSLTANPVPFAQALAGQAVTHTYASSGTYIVKVIALSGGSETSQLLDTIHVINQINLPVTFDDPNTDYTVSDFGGNVSVVTADPANPANHVLMSTKTVGAQTYAGVTIGTALGFAKPVPLSATTSRMSVMVYSPAAGLDVKLKIEDHTNSAHSVETDVLTTTANQWETLTFDFNNNASGTPALNTTWVYDKASIFYDFGNPGTGSVFYCDNLQLASPLLTQIDLPVTFESTTVDYTLVDFGNAASTLTTDPTNASNHVVKTVRPSNAASFAGTTMGPNGFLHPVPSATPVKMTVRVLSPAAGIDVKLKLEDHANGANSVETDVKTTLAGQWETLTFDFSQNTPPTPAWNTSYRYDKCSIFFDFGKTGGTSEVFYWDDVYLLP